MLLAGAALSGCATAADLTAFERTLAAQDSATAALGVWCEARGIADPPTISAQRIANAPPSPPTEVRELLRIVPGETIAYRHVELNCGRTALSIAHNWYVPARLTPAMNHALDTSDTPFGRVAAPLGYTRRRLAEKRGALPGCPPGTVLSHRAVLDLPGGRRLSALVECYTAANLAPR